MLYFDAGFWSLAYIIESYMTVFKAKRCAKERISNIQSINYSLRYSKINFITYLILPLFKIPTLETFIPQYFSALRHSRTGGHDYLFPRWLGNGAGKPSERSALSPWRGRNMALRLSA